MCVWVSKQKGGPAVYGKEVQQEEIQPDDGRNEGNIKSEHCGGMCTGVSRFFKHLPAPFTVGAANSEGGISAKLKYFSGRMLLNVLYTNTASYSEQSDSNRKRPTLSYSNGSFSLFVYSTKSCMLHNKITAHYCASAQRVHIFLTQAYFMSRREKK